MAGRTLETAIRISGELDKGVQRALDAVTENLDEIDRAARKAGGAAGELAGKISDQSKVLEAAKRKYASYVLAGEESTEQAQKLAREIVDLSSDLKKNQKALDAAEDAADELARGFDDVDDEARETKDGFSILRGAAANLVSTGIQKVVDVCADAISNFYGLSESTREYREDLAKLETAFQTAGHTTDEATAVYKELYSVFGEEDRAVEAAQQIAKLSDNAKEMATMTNIATGAWATWGDSLATESLMEAMNSSAKIGEVQGTLADALEWSGVNLDDFNKRLGWMRDEEMRSAYIMETLNGLYGEAADNYRVNNDSIIAAREAQSDYNDQLAELGERMEPVTTAVTRGMSGLLDKVLELVSASDLAGFAETVAGAFDSLGRAIDWVSENAGIIIPIIAGVTGALVAYKLASIAALLPTISLTGAITFLTSPILWIAVAIGAAIAAGIALYNNWDLVKAKAMELGGKLNEIWTNVSNAVRNMIDKVGQYFPIFGGYLSGWWSSISAAVENVKGVFRGIIDFISNVFAGNWRDAWDNVVSIFGNLFGGILNLAKAPINGVVGAINSVIDGINGVGFTIPDWVPSVGGETFSINIPKIPMLATGGFTDGISIAGEEGMEAVISFDPAYRNSNIGYWAEAGRMLGVDDTGFGLSGEGGAYYDMGGVTFAPNIVIHGEADKRTIMEAIEDEYPEFIDMLEEWFAGRGKPEYAGTRYY